MARAQRLARSFDGGVSPSPSNTGVFPIPLGAGCDYIVKMFSNCKCFLKLVDAFASREE